MSETFSRRRVIGTSAAVVAAPALAACGGDRDETDVVPELPDSGTLLGSTDTVPEGGCELFRDARVVVTQPSTGEFKAFSAECTHAGCLVDSSTSGVIPCPCHGSEFDLSTGAVVGGGRTNVALPEVDIEVRGNEIYTI